MNSPFINQVTDCKKRMRKLRKKIYKHTAIHNDKKTNTKNQDLSFILINIFQKRQLPQSIISNLKNKRNIDIFSLKSLVMGNQRQLKWDPITLKHKTSTQQQQVQELYKEHCQRMFELKKIQNLRFPHRRPFGSNYISSTQGDYSQSEELFSQQMSKNSRYSSEGIIQEEQKQEYDNNLCQQENSLEENLFGEVLIDRKQGNYKILTQAFSSFEMDENSILFSNNLFNF